MSSSQHPAPSSHFGCFGSNRCEEAPTLKDSRISEEEREVGVTVCHNRRGGRGAPTLNDSRISEEEREAPTLNDRVIECGWRGCVTTGGEGAPSLNDSRISEG